MIDLSLVPVEDLLHEVMNRHEAAIFCGLTHPKSPDDYMLRRLTRGHVITCAGLCSQMAYSINERAVDEQRPCEEP